MRISFFCKIREQHTKLSAHYPGLTLVGKLAHKSERHALVFGSANHLIQVKGQ